MAFTSNVPDEQERSQYILGFPKGLNIIQDRSLIGDHGLIQADNAIIVVDGLERRLGTDRAFDDGGASYVYGSFAYYNKTTAAIKYLRAAAARIQYLDGSTWTNVAATAYTNANTEFVQARNKVYIYNGIDALSNYNGSVLTTYTAITTPTNLTITPQGSAGTTTYSYKITAFNDTGETAASSAATTTTGNATLDNTNYNRVTWTAVANATGYNIFGRTATGYAEVYLTTVYGQAIAQWDDKGTATPVTSHLPPTTNSSGGIIGKYAVFAQGRQWVAGATEGTTYYPTRLYWSGVLDHVDTFVGGEYGGGWVEIDSNDGGEIVGVHPYRNGVMVLKNNGIFRAYFTSSGAIAVEEITKAHGGVSHRAVKAIDNDIIYVGQKDNRIEIYSVGYQQNYTTDVLRTNNISVFISDGLTNVNRSKLTNIAAFYWDNKFGFTYTTSSNTQNSVGYVLDTRFGGWVKWNGLPMEVNHYSTYDDGTTKKIYGGSNSDGYMIEMFTTNYSDDGSAYSTIVGTKFFNGGMFDIEKIWRNPTLWFKYISGGSIDCELWIDGTRKVGTASLLSSESGTGAGADLWGASMFGTMSSSTADSTPYADLPLELTGIFFSKSIGFYIIDNSITTNWRFMGLHLLFTPLSGKPLPQENRFELT